MISLVAIYSTGAIIFHLLLPNFPSLISLPKQKILDTIIKPSCAKFFHNNNFYYYLGLYSLQIFHGPILSTQCLVPG